jgi:hypothetical protein
MPTERFIVKSAPGNPYLAQRWGNSTIHRFALRMEGWTNLGDIFHVMDVLK